MNRRLATALLGVIWAVFGAIFVATEEPAGWAGSHWEDARGWVWVVAGGIAVATALAGRLWRWPLVLLGALAGERVAILAVATATSRPLLEAPALAALVAWCGLLLAVVLTASIPPGRRL